MWQASELKTATPEVKYVTNLWQASEPKTATPGLDGYDLHAAESKIVNPRSSTPISLYLDIGIPKGFYGTIFPSQVWHLTTLLT